MSEALQSFEISRTRNALLPSVSSWIQCSGNNEVQLENLKASNSMQMDNLFHFQSNGFNLECSRIFNNNSQFRNGGNTNPSQSQSSFDQYDADDYNHQTASLYGVPSREGISQQALFLKTPSMSQNEGDNLQLRSARKRPLEATDNMELMKKIKNDNPKSKITIMEPNWHQSKKSSEAIHSHQLQVPGRRKQKLSDKITTLQKLVSPYGKTDTASVLHEASLYIKLLQEQIQNLFRMLSLSYNNARVLASQEGGEEVVDLRSKGLCLVPIPITRKSNNGKPDSSWNCPKDNNPAHEFLMHIDYNL